MSLLQREEQDQEALVHAKRLQLTNLHQRRDATASEAQQCQAAIRGKADIAKQEREK